MESNNLTGKEATAKLKSIAEEVDIAMMCTHSMIGHIDSRPMSTAGVDEDGALWFFTDDDSEKLKQIQSEKGLCLCYSQPSKNTYMTVAGHADQVDDENKKKELWSDIMKAWYPKGLDDPQLTLIKVTPHQAEYWDDSNSKMVVFFKIAKAILSGDTYGDDKGNHGELKF